MRHRPHRSLALLALLALPACATTPAPVAGGTPRLEAPARTAGLGETPTRRGGMRVAEMGRRGCAASALDNPAAAQRLMAATFAEGPRNVEAPVFACGPVFRAL